MEGFNAWAKRHCTVFGLFDPRHFDMIAAWQDLFDAARYGAAELHAATDWLAANAPPRFPGDHLGAIQRRVREGRAVAYRRQEQEASACVLCGGGGMLSVPHLIGVVASEWVPMNAGAGATLYTQAVRCSCARGRLGNFSTKNRSTGAEIDLMHLDAYESRNPGWREQMARREREDAAAAAAVNGPASPALDEVLESLRRRVHGGQGCDF